MLDKLKYIILGIIQGLTEPLPISSSGHLVIFKNLFNLDSLNDLNFEIIVNFASFLAISFIYRKDIIKLIKDSIIYLKTKNYKYENSFKYILLIILACIPAGILGLLFKDKIDLISTNVKYIGIALLITSLALFIVRKIDGKKHDNDITYKDSIIIGLFQGIALLPGISRSGSTLTGGLLRNIKKEDAEKINSTKLAGNRVIAVGTTSCRTIETVADKNGLVRECEGDTGIYIYPGYKFKCLDALITNFHLPESTLIMLV